MKLGLFSVSTQIHLCSLSTRGRERGWGGDTGLSQAVLASGREKGRETDPDTYQYSRFRMEGGTEEGGILGSQR